MKLNEIMITDDNEDEFIADIMDNPFRITRIVNPREKIKVAAFVSAVKNLGLPEKVIKRLIRYNILPELRNLDAELLLDPKVVKMKKDNGTDLYPLLVINLCKGNELMLKKLLRYWEKNRV